MEKLVRSQIVYGLAEMINNENVSPILEGKKIVMLDIIALISGTHFRGMFEERVDGLFKELKGSTKYILFLDDIHNMLKSNGKDVLTESAFQGPFTYKGVVEALPDKAMLLTYQI